MRDFPCRPHGNLRVWVPRRFPCHTLLPDQSVPVGRGTGCCLSPLVPSCTWLQAARWHACPHRGDAVWVSQPRFAPRGSWLYLESAGVGEEAAGSPGLGLCRGGCTRVCFRCWILTSQPHPFPSISLELHTSSSSSGSSRPEDLAQAPSPPPPHPVSLTFFSLLFFFIFFSSGPFIFAELNP